MSRTKYIFLRQWLRLSRGRAVCARIIALSILLAPPHELSHLHPVPRRDDMSLALPLSPTRNTFAALVHQPSQVGDRSLTRFGCLHSTPSLLRLCVLLLLAPRRSITTVVFAWRCVGAVASHQTSQRPVLIHQCRGNGHGLLYSLIHRCCSTLPLARLPHIHGRRLDCHCQLTSTDLRFIT